MAADCFLIPVLRAHACIMGMACKGSQGFWPWGACMPLLSSLVYMTWTGFAAERVHQPVEGRACRPSRDFTPGGVCTPPVSGLPQVWYYYHVWQGTLAYCR